MNERIKELMDQARAPLHNKDLPFNQGLTEYSEKFAELIVAECCQAFETEVDSWKEMNPYQGSIKRQGTRAIKHHFGVEEK